MGGASHSSQMSIPTAPGASHGLGMQGLSIPLVAARSTTDRYDVYLPGAGTSTCTAQGGAPVLAFQTNTRGSQHMQEPLDSRTMSPRTCDTSNASARSGLCSPAPALPERRERNVLEWFLLQ